MSTYESVDLDDCTIDLFDRDIQISSRMGLFDTDSVIFTPTVSTGIRLAGLAARAAIQQSDTPLPEDASLATIFARAIRILNEDLSIEEEREW